MERRPMNGFGEPNMGNPSVRFDEGRERVGHWPVCLSIHPFPPTLLALIPIPGVGKVLQEGNEENEGGNWEGTSQTNGIKKMGKGTTKIPYTNYTNLH